METVFFFLKLKLNIIIIISDRSTYLKKGALKPLTIHPFVWYIRSNDEFTFYNLFSPTKPYQGQQNLIRDNKTLSGPTKPCQAQQNPIRPNKTLSGLHYTYLAMLISCFLAVRRTNGRTPESPLL